MASQGPSGNQEDIVDTIAQYDLDEDFPDYANEQNKELNQIVREKVRLVAQLGLEIEEHQERLKILAEHLKSVQMELVHTQSLVDAKNKEIETEEHMKQITERQSGRLKNEIEKLDNRIADQQDRLNNIQNMIFKANEKMDQFKLEMNWNQEELEQWALAARQKEEDNLTLEKYRRADEAKIKELTLQIEKLTIEVAKKANELEKEVTETQAAQIELDKTAEEFKRLHSERHQLYLQWQETVENSRKRDELINETGEDYARAKDYLDKKKADLEDNKTKLQREQDNNTGLNGDIATQERILTKIREALAISDTDRKNLDGEVAILRNQLSAFATELSNKRIDVSNINTILEEKMQRLDAAKKKYNATKDRLAREKDIQDNLEKGNKMSVAEYKESESMMTEVEKEIREQKETLFKESQKLFKLRAEQANLIGDISGTLSASRNLQASINKLKQEKQRQQELLYNSEYQIQQMERKVSRAQGERSQEEQKRLQQEITTAQAKLDKIRKQLDMLIVSNKQLVDEKRNIERVIEKVKSQRATLETQIQELKLENEMAGNDLTMVQGTKEKTLVQHDCKKLEIKKLRDTVNVEADRVYGLENRKYQLEMSMEEREKEIQVHKDILVSESKAAEEERHKVAVELMYRKTRVKNLRIKYEGLIQKNKSTSGDGDQGEHSQAYYVIKAAQEKEELQRYGDELDGKLRKCEKEIKALANTLDHLKMRNKNYRDKFIQGAEGADLEKKQILEDQCRAASETLFKKRRELQKLQKDYDDDARGLMEIRTKSQALQKQNEATNLERDRFNQDINAQLNKFQKAETGFQTAYNNVKQVQGDAFDDSKENVEIIAEVENQKTNHLLNALSVIINEFPALGTVIKGSFGDELQIPSRPQSAIERPITSSSQRSQGQQ